MSLKKSSMLSVGCEHVVLSVDIFINRGVFFCLDADDSLLSALFDGRQFRVTSDKLPSNWVDWKDTSGEFGLQPASWLKPGFWEDYFNDSPDALESFKTESEVILMEA